MKRIIILSLLLLQSSFVYAVDFSDTDKMYGWNGSSQFFPLWSDHKTQLESELSFLTNDEGCTISSGTMSCTGGFVSTSADGTHYGDVTNTVAITASAAEGNFSYYDGRMRLADGVDWTSNYFLEFTDIGVSVQTALTIITDTQALATVEIADGACATTITPTATGAVAGDGVDLTFASSPLAVTGYGVGAYKGLEIKTWATTDEVNIAVCNDSGAAITPGAMSIKWGIIK